MSQICSTNQSYETVKESTFMDIIPSIEASLVINLLDDITTADSGFVLYHIPNGLLECLH